MSDYLANSHLSILYNLKNMLTFSGSVHVYLGKWPSCAHTHGAIYDKYQGRVSSMLTWT